MKARVVSEDMKNLFPIIIFCVTQRTFCNCVNCVWWGFDGIAVLFYVRRASLLVKKTRICD